MNAPVNPGVAVTALKVNRTADTTDWQDSRNYISFCSFFSTPTYFSECLCKGMPSAGGRGRLLDIGCGSGIVGIYGLLHNKAAFVTFTDVQFEAIAETCSNVVKHIEQGRLTCTQAQFVEPVEFTRLPCKLAADHDLVAFNPPQIPLRFLDEESRNKVQGDRTTGYFRNGGCDGLDPARVFLHWYAGLDNPKPLAVILLSSLLGKTEIDAAIHEAGLTYEVVNAERVPLREMFWPAVERLDRTEHDNRLLERAERGWTKVLLPCLLHAA